MSEDGGKLLTKTIKPVDTITTIPDNTQVFSQYFSGVW